MTDDVVEWHDRATREFDRRVRAVGADQWDAPTPCTEWDVRTLVNHLVNESLWVAPLLDGSTIAEVGDRFGGDLLGDDPVRAWQDASATASTAVHADGATGQQVHLSFGDTSGEDYLWQLVSDLTLHSWDLARGIGADDTLDPELVEVVLTRIAPAKDELAASGVFGAPVPVAEDADPQTRLLGMMGRRR